MAVVGSFAASVGFRHIGGAVEVVASDVAFERYIVSGLRYNLVDLHHEVTHLIIWLKRLEMSRKISNFAA